MRPLCSKATYVTTLVKIPIRSSGRLLSSPYFGIPHNIPKPFRGDGTLCVRLYSTLEEKPATSEIVDTAKNGKELRTPSPASLPVPSPPSSLFARFRHKVGWEIIPNETAELGKPAVPGSPYHQTSLTMPSLQQVDDSVRAIRKEHDKLRIGAFWCSVFGVIVCVLMAARESEHPLWIILTTIMLKTTPPELAHQMVMTAAKLNKLPTDTKIDDPHMKMSICGVPFPNPIGLAAGFDKSCENPLAFLKMGFGSVEVGTITPFPQDGNPKPRIFRLEKDKAIINRCGFNNSGIEAAARRLARFSKTRWQHDLCRLGVIGVNIGKNKDSNNPVWDYVETAKRVAPYADYLVINVSSPNTPGLRSLQKKSDLEKIVMGVQKVLDVLMADVERQRAETLAELKLKHDTLPPDEEFPFSLPTLTGRRPPLFVKIAPDLTSEDMKEIAQVVIEQNVDGMIISNTTISRPETLKTEDKTLIAEAGGLSGAPLKDKSTAIIREMYSLTGGLVPIIAVGGISTGHDAMEKIEAGASAVQVYSAMIYEGPGIIRRIKRELSTLMYSRGHRCLQDAVGAAHRKALPDIHSTQGVPFHKRKSTIPKPPKFDDKIDMGNDIFGRRTPAPKQTEAGGN